MPIEQLFFDLIGVASGSCVRLSHTPSQKEWAELYDIALKQSLVGVCFVGLQKLGADADEGFARIGMSEMLYLSWMGMAAKIQQRNQTVDLHCIELQSRLSAAGFRSCVLKGQAAGLLYDADLRHFRQSGDIDIWVDGGFERVNGWVQKTAPTKVVNQHHVALDVFDDTEVEVHYHPINLTNPWRQMRLKAFIRQHEDECLTGVDDGKIHVPSWEFNMVFMLVHIYHHLFTEGVGLRQIMDYYFLMRSSASLSSSDQHCIQVQKVVSDLELQRFASALMWVLGEVFGLPDDEMLWKPNEDDGQHLLREIMLSGNFGKSDVRQRGLYDSKLNSFFMIHMKTIRFWRFDHWAWLWSPVSRIRGFAWRRWHGYRQY